MTETTSAPKPERVDAREFPDALAEHGFVLVDFYTKGCTLCRSVEPVLGSVDRATGVPMLLVNPKDDPSLVAEHDVRSVPTLALFRDGEEVGRVADGFVSAERLVEFVESNR
ncbi:thioredoxin family protein [Halorarum salinum]|uniref:Thioredoxin family protein n=1 Tax=Halorarum salinum TaxID=2743089 RepID=A0A7D5QC24_9EURY|nr:thioredoxin family protein [Halobaculum salinum]QLG63018.1 thioredoxin family protein [Halobaculum salinum]